MLASLIYTVVFSLLAGRHVRLVVAGGPVYVEPEYKPRNFERIFDATTENGVGSGFKDYSYGYESLIVSTDPCTFYRDIRLRYFRSDLSVSVYFPSYHLTILHIMLTITCACKRAHRYDLHSYVSCNAAGCFREGAGLWVSKTLMKRCSCAMAVATHHVSGLEVGGSSFLFFKYSGNCASHEGTYTEEK